MKPKVREAKRTHLTAILIGLAAIAALSSTAHARYYQTGMNVYPAVATPMPPVAGGFGTPHVGVNVYPSITTPMPHPDGPNLYQYVRSNPVNLVDPYGLVAVDPGKDCGLTSNSQWALIKPIHFWLKDTGGGLWDFGPDYAWLDQRYGNHDYSLCGIFKYCRGEANWGNNSYAGQTGQVNHSLKLQWDFLFIGAKIQEGPKKGTPCKCATCGDITGCLDAVRQSWDGTRYDHLFRHCGTFVFYAMSNCCLRE